MKKCVSEQLTGLMSYIFPKDIWYQLNYNFITLLTTFFDIYDLKKMYAYQTGGV